jgi:aryl-alcohol dehydrogenase-like predicted oxidoreductase
MIQLGDLSRIGFGGYRVCITAAHYEALVHALSLGCTLIDTSATYTDGQSETLVGNVLAENPQYDAFIVTKAGYIQGRALARVPHFNEQGVAKKGFVTIAGTRRHSIHPDFLNAQMEQSRNRLKRRWLDGFLLHNPEYYFEHSGDETSDTEYYAKIKQAFEFLEECVERGALRYYGISSNSFPRSTASRGTTNLNRVLEVARQVSADHHCRLIEFPFNLIEREALTPHHDGESLIELARRSGVLTFGNRPFNALRDGKAIRLATYDMELIDQVGTKVIWQDFLNRLARQLDVIEITGGPEQFEIVALLNSHWTSLESPDAVLSAFQEHLYPLLLGLFQNSIPDDVTLLVRKLYEVAIRNTRKSMSERALALCVGFVESGLLDATDNRPLVVAACENYLNAGIDHVLAGMRRKAYVEDLKTLFRV